MVCEIDRIMTHQVVLAYHTPNSVEWDAPALETDEEAAHSSLPTAVGCQSWLWQALALLLVQRDNVSCHMLHHEW